ncbi:High mobility group protein B3 [Galemys pyrenaicus]|uniref:High mobility group protein B3 n=1 Tax=Galemys pyrenaicus TaxID=202257 RepID=A0A8J6DHL2_GALPY|nr:High mobility group protein B3 [Galemys pyrenaicus]
MCRKEHKMKTTEDPLNFTEFSKKCSERWKTRSEKSKFDEKAKADQVHNDREMKAYGPKFCPNSKSVDPGIPIKDVAKKLGEMQNNVSDSERQSDSEV